MAFSTIAKKFKNFVSDLTNNMDNWLDKYMSVVLVVGLVMCFALLALIPIGMIGTVYYHNEMAARCAARSGHMRAVASGVYECQSAEGKWIPLD